MNNSDLFDRIEFKHQAKKRLRNSWTIPVLITLIFYVIFFMINKDAFEFSMPDFSNIQNFAYSYSYNVSPSDENATISLLTSLVNIIIYGIFGIAFAKFYLDMTQKDKMQFQDFLNNLSMFTRGILGQLWMTLWIFLWSLLFFIPGIVKTFAYSQMHYILAEYPEVSVTEAMKISMKITKGYKWDIFVMYLSFLGWMILSMLSCGIGFLWLIPYMNLSSANAYKFLLENALVKNRITKADLHISK
ncbi:MAG: DUF975 family protein [Treponemataceae bacterium]|nr:DUF975 family protein [Treponemataceae bacterium]